MKINFWKFFLIMIIFLNISLSCFAGETASLNLENAVEIALVNNLDLEIARINLEKSELEYEKNIAANLAQNSRYSNLQAEIGIDSARNTYQKTEAQIISDILKQYTNIWLSKYDLTIKEKQLVLEEKLLKEARNQYEIGDIGEVSLLEKENDYKDVDFELTTALDNFEQSKKELKSDLGLEAKEIELTALSFRKSLDITEEEAQSSALENSIDIALQRKKVELAEIDLERAEISSPLLDKKIKEKSLDAARLELDKAISQLKNEVQNMYFEYMQMIKKININLKRLEEAEKKYNLKEKQFEVGLLTQRELMEFELNMMRTKYNYFSAVADYHLKEEVLREKIGLKSGVLSGEAAAE